MIIKLERLTVQSRREQEHLLAQLTDLEGRLAALR